MGSVVLCTHSLNKAPRHLKKKELNFPALVVGSSACGLWSAFVLRFVWYRHHCQARLATAAAASRRTPRRGAEAATSAICY